MKSALSASIHAEDEAVKTRFERAEALLGGQNPLNRLEGVVLAEDQDSPSKEVKKERVIRDSFTLPSDDYELIAALKKRCLLSAVNVTKSEVIRAGLHALHQLSDNELLSLIDSLAKVKTGRPSSSK
ncbi:hypothetical protein [Chroococcus sp. FPU101]|uniref:hypothetical protein n=1 Tax=Chroococcus sp. FPU101 TaxID=1974212 RepID=UPI001A8D5625|nr:hypothetical protein [Chroococcus sp. FPU101]GFE71667.1 hypothetical protein CFPU101_42770 [Chroococcus sp. FPU101]